MTPRSSHHCDLQSLWSGEGGAGEEAVTAGGQGGESSTSFSYVVRASSRRRRDPRQLRERQFTQMCYGSFSDFSDSTATRISCHT